MTQNKMKEVLSKYESSTIKIYVKLCNNGLQCSLSTFLRMYYNKKEITLNCIEAIYKAYNIKANELIEHKGEF